MKHYILGLLVLFVSVMTVACSDDVKEQFSDEKIKVQTRLAGYVVGGNDATMSAEKEVTDVKACLFEDGVLTMIYDNLAGNDGCYNFFVNSNYGNLYVVANTEKLIDWDAIIAGHTTEEDWIEQTVSMDGDDAPMFFTGKVVLEKQPTNVPVKMTLKRGVARLDITMERDDIKVKSVTLKNVAEKGYLNVRESVLSPGNEKVNVTKTWDEFLSGKISGVMYLCEQLNGDLLVELNVSVSGEDRHISTKLPEQIKRNAVYTLNLGGDGSNLNLNVNIDEWDYADETVLIPDFEDKITVDINRSDFPEGVTIGDNNSQLVFDYLPKEFILALDCNDQLEVSNISEIPFEMTALEESKGKNLFRVRKRLMPIGHEVMTGTVHFKRKGLNNTYQEDMLELVLNANPNVWYSFYSIDLDTYTCDFKDYFDGDIAYIIPAEGKKVSIEIEGDEDKWVIVQESGGMQRVLAGWRPNDPKADGREQKATLVISDKETGSNREEYKIVRRNYGLPVVQMNGIWWCKYNAMGQSNNFKDQILVPDDPAAKEGKTVLDYLNSCSAEEYVKLWGWSYQDATGKGMKVVAKNNVIKLDGFPSPQKVNINKLGRTDLSPSGYELPNKSYYDRIFAVYWMKVDVTGGPYSVKRAWDGNTQVFVTSGNRRDLVVDGVNVPITYHFEVYDKKNGERDEAVTFYGPGAQWNANGINHNKIMFGCYSTSSGWFNAFVAGGEGFRETGGSENDTRILRFIKSPVEYIY